MLLETITIGAAIINFLTALGIGFFALQFYLKFLKIKEYIKMNPEELLDNTNFFENKVEKEDNKKERLFALVAGGNSKLYFGKELQVSDIENMTPDQINKLYCRYEARLGASMTKTLGNSLITLYVFGISRYFEVVDPPKFIKNLEEDPFVNHALTSICCNLYYKYGMYLAPFTAVLTTLQNVDFTKKINIENDEPGFEPRAGESKAGESKAGESKAGEFEQAGVKAIESFKAGNN